MKVFYTFGSDARFLFQGGWVEVEASSLKEAHAVFRAYYPDQTPGILNCSDYYTEAQFYNTDMPTTGNRGAWCHRRLRAGQAGRREAAGQKIPGSDGAEPENRSSRSPVLSSGLLCRRQAQQQDRRQAAMDRITLGECLHLHRVLGWTAHIQAGHLVSLGNDLEKEAAKNPSFDSGRTSGIRSFLSAGRKNPGGAAFSAGLTCRKSTDISKGSSIVYQSLRDMASRKLEGPADKKKIRQPGGTSDQGKPVRH